MTPKDLLQEVSRAGVAISIDPPDKLKIVGAQDVVDKWLPAIRQNKGAILAALASAHKVEKTSSVCRDCNRLEWLELQEGQVAGCLYSAALPYTSGWRRLPDDLKGCLWQ